MRIASTGELSIGTAGISVGGAPVNTAGELNIYSTEGGGKWLQQMRADHSAGNGLFVRAGSSSSYYTAHFTGYDEANVHLSIRGDGAVTKPKNPCFMAKANNDNGDVLIGVTGWAGGGSWGYVVPFPYMSKSHSECFDSGNNLSTISTMSTNSYCKFTCPVDGRYLFMFNCGWDNKSSADWLSIGITVNSETANVEANPGYTFVHSNTDHPDSGGGNGVIIELEEDDYVVLNTQSVDNLLIETGGMWSGCLIS